MSIGQNARDWVEPAHPAIFEHYEDILAIYRYIQQNLQPEIDGRFDRIARQIGYVVASTVPVILEFSDDGALKDVEIGADHLRGTLFEPVRHSFDASSSGLLDTRLRYYITHGTL